jgi:hypothetical protein
MKSSYESRKKIPFYKKKQFMTIIVGVFLIMLMVLSAVSLGFDQSEEEDSETIVVYGLEFLLSSNGYVAATDEGGIIIQTSPEDLEEVEEFDWSILGLATKVYISFDPEGYYSGAAVYEIEQNIGLSGVVYSCYEDSEACTELPIKTCEDAEISTAVVVLEESDQTFVSYENNCLTITGQNLLRVVDSLIVQYYGKG